MYIQLYIYNERHCFYTYRRSICSAVAREPRGPGAYVIIDREARRQQNPSSEEAAVAQGCSPLLPILRSGRAHSKRRVERDLRCGIVYNLSTWNIEGSAEASLAASTPHPVMVV